MGVNISGKSTETSPYEEFCQAWWFGFCDQPILTNVRPKNVFNIEVV
jgi:hypothetical protein